MTEQYSEHFYERYNESSRLSAAVVVPYLIEWFDPVSVVDVGCGEGVWLSVFRELGVSDVRGLDGDYVNRSRLKIPAECFTACDLSKPLPTGHKCSLVMSLEVAEHLPEDSAVELVTSLCELSDVVVFSAAIPFQGGTDHINLQWQGYWAGLFSAKGYVVIDALRPLIWDDDRVSFWYRQNTLVYVKKERLETLPQMAALRQRTNVRQLSMAHPALVANLGAGPPSAAQLDRLYFGQILSRIPAMLLRAFRRRIQALTRFVHQPD